MNNDKLGRFGDLTSETYNGAMNTRRLIFEQVHEAEAALRKYDSHEIRVSEVGYWNHLINVWLGGITKAL